MVKRSRIQTRLQLGFTPAEARALVRDIEDGVRADAYQQLRKAIEDELASVSDPVGPFESGAAAAYHWVLSRLGTASGDDPPDASHHLFPASVSPATESLPLRNAVAILADRWDDLARLPGQCASLWRTAAGELRTAMRTFAAERQPERCTHVDVDVMRLRRALERGLSAVDDEWTIEELAELAAAEYAGLEVES